MESETEQLEQAAMELMAQENGAPNLPSVAPNTSVWIDPIALERLNKAANIWSKSKLIPELYRGNVNDCAIAVHLATQLGVDVLMFMNKSYQVRGKFALEGQLIKAIADSKGYYDGGVQFEYSGDGDTRKCVAFGIRRSDGQREAAECSIRMAKDAGWWGKQDSWWPKMPDQMLAYRSATFLVRRYHPGWLLGLQTIEEVLDVTSASVSDSRGKAKVLTAQILDRE